MKGRVGIYRVQNIRRFVVAKGSTQRQRVSTQKRKDLRCCVPESGQGATQRRKVFHRCVPESYAAKLYVAT